MKEVKIYIETTIKGALVRDGKYAAVLVCTGAGGKLHERFLEGKEEDSTANRLTLLAIIYAMRRLNQRCRVIIYTDNTYIKNMVESENPEKWRREEWKRAAGRDVKNKELWVLFLEEKEKHKVEIRFSRHDEYMEKLRAVLDAKEIEDV